MRINVKLLHPNAVMPTCSTSGSVGFDLYACEPVVIPAGKAASVRTGVAVEMPTLAHLNVEAQVRGRSGMAFKHRVVTHVGTIDPDYRGEIGVMLFNFGSEPYSIAVGDRVAQLVFAPVFMPALVEAEELTSTARGAKGFGSTGR